MNLLFNKTIFTLEGHTFHGVMTHLKTAAEALAYEAMTYTHSEYRTDYEGYLEEKIRDKDIEFMEQYSNQVQEDGSVKAYIYINTNQPEQLEYIQDIFIEWFGNNDTISFVPD